MKTGDIVRATGKNDFGTGGKHLKIRGVRSDGSVYLKDDSIPSDTYWAITLHDLEENFEVVRDLTPSLTTVTVGDFILIREAGTLMTGANPGDVLEVNEIKNGRVYGKTLDRRYLWSFTVDAEGAMFEVLGKQAAHALRQVICYTPTRREYFAAAALTGVLSNYKSLEQLAEAGKKMGDFSDRFFANAILTSVDAILEKIDEVKT